MLLQATEFAKNPSLIVGMSIVIVVLSGVIVALFAYIKALVKENKDDLKVLVKQSIESNLELTSAIKSLDQTSKLINEKVEKIFIDTEVEKRVKKSIVT